MRGRKLYLSLAEASFENASELSRDADALRRRGSRGHSYSLAVLSIEEAAKAYLYKLAGEQIFRIVSKNPNGITTYSESQLSDHKFKHALIARLIVQAIALTPIQAVLAKSRKPRFSRKEVALMMSDLLHEQALLNIQLRPEGRAGKQVQRLFQTLEKSNSRKNAGLYVDQLNGSVRRPNDCSKQVLREGLELADLALGAVREILDAGFGTHEREQTSRELREVAKALRLTGSKTSVRTHAKAGARVDGDSASRA